MTPAHAAGSRVWCLLGTLAAAAAPGCSTGPSVTARDAAAADRGDVGSDSAVTRDGTPGLDGTTAPDAPPPGPDAAPMDASPPPPDTRPPGDPCSLFTACTNCAFNPACGWCAGSARCQSGSATGPTSGACGAGWVWQARDCSTPPPPVDAGTTDAATTDGASDGITVRWGTACWHVEAGRRYQAMPFSLTTATPVPLEGTLFFTTTCSPSGGTDNLNDTGATTGSGSWLFWFIHHPDETNTSADWWLGTHHSGCVDYSHAPDC